MNYYHVLWTRPLFSNGTAESQDIVLWDFELLTWLLSALQARQHGPLRLITDSRGALATERAGFTGLYRQISTALDAVPRCLDPDVFWAGGKLFAYGAMETPWVCVDLDAVLWKPVESEARVMALHPEPKEWCWYRGNREEFAAFGFEEQEWNWDLDPFNTGVLSFADPNAARYYVTTACNFAERYSREVCSNPATRPKGSHAMLFAEQRLLPMCAARYGVEVVSVTPSRPGATCLPNNAECLHLWRSKLAYKVCEESRLALVNWAISHLLKHFPEAHPVLARWGLDREQKGSAERRISSSDFDEIHKGDLRFSLLKNVKGHITVTDSTTGITRGASAGCMVWSGEILHPEPGTEFEVEVIGLDSLKVRAMA